MTDQEFAEHLQYRGATQGGIAVVGVCVLFVFAVGSVFVAMLASVCFSVRVSVFTVFFVVEIDVRFADAAFWKAVFAASSFWTLVFCAVKSDSRSSSVLMMPSPNMLL